jgi:hypothetical protein
MKKWIADHPISSIWIVSLLILAAFAYLAHAQTISHGIALSWSWSGSGTPTYNIYRASTAGGEVQPPYASGVTGGTTPCAEGTQSLPNPCWQDPAPVIGTKYYYTVTAVVGGIESGPSPEVSAQIVLPNAPTAPATAAH